MGQPIEIVGTTRLDDVVMFDTDRSITGQDGSGYGSLDEATATEDFPALLAARLFEGVDGVNHVFVASNGVVVRRTGGWDDAAAGAAGEIITDFFIFYRD
jgi:hypothetical protein